MMKRTLQFLILTVVALAIGSLLWLRVFATPEAPVQPIEYSHWQHVTKPDGPQLECTFCHEYADQSAHATVPNVSTCMLCHENAKTDSPEVQKLAAFAARNQQPPWKRIFSFPASAHVFFTHKPHMRAQMKCEECHGRIGEMPRVRREVEHTMGWCMDCHRQRQVSNDCLLCHR